VKRFPQLTHSLRLRVVFSGESRVSKVLMFSELQ
jgi:hypothetical protein